MKRLKNENSSSLKLTFRTRVCSIARMSYFRSEAYWSSPNSACHPSIQFRFRVRKAVYFLAKVIIYAHDFWVLTAGELGPHQANKTGDIKGRNDLFIHLLDF